MKNARLLLIDSDPYTASVVQDELARRGFFGIQHVSALPDFSLADAPDLPDMAILNYQSERADLLEACNLVRRYAPRAGVIAIVSPGPALRKVRAWASETGCIDVIVEKPLSDERFFMALRDLLAVKVMLRELEQKTERLTTLIPEDALALVEDTQRDAELFAAVVLFTDIRSSSKFIQELAPRDYFSLLNQVLSAQSSLIRRYQGTVVKYTGDGILAVFRGMGKSYLALSCAIALARQSEESTLNFGVGAAEGLVLSGLIGDSLKHGDLQQYDVIGATVNLSARLCSLAAAGQVVALKQLNALAKIACPAPQEMGQVEVKGFDAMFECIVFTPSYQGNGKVT